MTERINPTISIERASRERDKALFDALIESWQELFATGFFPDPTPTLTLEEVESWIKDFDEMWESNKQYRFQIIETTSNQLVGGIFLNHVIRTHKLANMGYWVRTSRAGEGIATEAAKQVAQYGFEKLGLQRIEIVVSKDNLPSLRIAEKISAVREGLLRNRVQIRGSAHDAYMYSLIPNDFGIGETA
jgi:RimJ/RimL family protein N-acetyltransferase